MLSIIIMNNIHNNTKELTTRTMSVLESGNKNAVKLEHFE